MDTGTVVGLFVAAAAMLGLGILAIVLSIKGLASSTEPDIRARSQHGEAKIGRPGLFVFLILGAILALVGIALLVAAIRGVA